MNAALAKVIDRFFITFILRKRRSFVKEEPPGEPLPALKEYLKEPGLFYLPTGDPALKPIISLLAGKTKLGDIYQLCFKSPITTPWPENNLLHATHFQAHHERSPHLIMLHGYQETRNIFHRWLARRLLEKGISSLVLELPYHMRRAPRGTFNGEYFFYRGINGALQAVRQAVAEACAAVNWLKETGCDRVGLFGSSLGGLIAALSCAVEPEIDFCILNVPALDLKDLTERSPAAAPIRKALGRKGEAARQELEPLSGIVTPALLKPLLGADDILVIQAAHDQFVPAQQLDALRESWGDFRIVVLPHGHISAFVFAGGTILRVAAEFITGRSSS